MSRPLLPLLFSDWWEHLDRPHRLFNQDFGSGIYADRLLVPRVPSYFPSFEEERRQRNSSLLNYFHPWNECLSDNYANSSSVSADKDKFQVIIDVQHFKPNEIDVKVVDKNVIVEAKHEEKQDEHGWISRQFMRKYKVPNDCNIDQLNSSLSSDGILTITAPKINDSPMLENERRIQIEHTGKPAIQQSSVATAAIKESKKDKKDKKDKDDKMED